MTIHWGDDWTAGRQKEKKAGVVSLFGDEEMGSAKNPVAGVPSKSVAYGLANCWG